MSRKPTIYTSVDELPDLNSGSQQQYNSVDELPDLKKKVSGSGSSTPSGGASSGTTSTTNNEGGGFKKRNFFSSRRVAKPSELYPNKLGKLKLSAVSYLRPNEQVAIREAGLFLAPPEEQEKIARRIIEARKESEKEQEEKQTYEVPNARDLVNPAPQDQTYMAKPISELDKQEAEQRRLQHQENIRTAISNTTNKYFKNMGLDIPQGSPMWNDKYKSLYKSLKNGDVSYHSVDNVPGLDKNYGWWEGIARGWNHAVNEGDEADQFVNGMDAAEKVAYLKDKKAQQEDFGEYYGEKPGTAGSFGELISGAAPIVVKAALGYAAGTALTAAAPATMGVSLAGLPTALAFAATAPDMANIRAKEEIEGGMNS